MVREWIYEYKAIIFLSESREFPLHIWTLKGSLSFQ